MLLCNDFDDLDDDDDDDSSSDVEVVWYSLAYGISHP